MLTDVEGVDPDRLCQDRLFDSVTDRLGAAHRVPGSVDRHRQERVESKFERQHRVSDSLVVASCEDT